MYVCLYVCINEWIKEGVDGLKNGRQWMSGWTEGWQWMSWFPLMPHQASLEAQMGKSLPAMQQMWVQSLSWEDSLEEEMATHSNILAWKIPRTEESGRLLSRGSQESDRTLWLNHHRQAISPSITHITSYRCKLETHPCHTVPQSFSSFPLAT